MYKKSPLKQFAPLIAIIVVFGIIVAAYGISRRDNEPATAKQEEPSQLTVAQNLLAANQPEKALEAIDAWKTTAKQGDIGEEGEFLRMQALESAGMNRELAEASDAFLKKFPSTTRATEVELMRLSAQVATAGLVNPALIAKVENFIAEHPDHPGAGRLILAVGRHEIALGDKTAARRRLARALQIPDINPATKAEIHRELGNLNLEALKRGDTGSEITYTVAKGDSIWAIATRYDLTPELLMEINNISDPRSLRVGQTLRVPSMKLSLECDITENRLVLYNNGEFIKSYPVRTGRVAGTTPTGEFKILNKKVDPTWRPGDGRVYLPGDPNNELGTRWMSFEGDILGIHGTIHPETVGHYASNGCIGMTKEDVEELFDIVMVGTPLKIVGQQDPTRHEILAAPSVPAPLTQNEIASLRR